MNVRLSVQNLPPQCSQEELHERFKTFKGFLNSQVFYNPKTRESVYAELIFASYESADYVKNVMNGYTMPGHNQGEGLIIDYVKQDYGNDYLAPQHAHGGAPIQHAPPPPPQYQGYIQQNIPQPQYKPHQQQQQQQPQGPPPPPPPPPQQAPPQQIYQPVQQHYQQQLPPPQPQQQQPHAFMAPPPVPPPAQQQQQGLAPPQQPGQNFNIQLLAQLLSGQTGAPVPVAQPYQQQQQYAPQHQNHHQSAHHQHHSGRHPSTPDIGLFKIPPDATNSLYIDGVPIDSNEREVAHIFRPFPGYERVRLIKRQAKSGREFYYCFVDFENVLQATIALHTLQGYRFDKNENNGFKISYAKEAHETAKEKKLRSSKRHR